MISDAKHTELTRSDVQLVRQAIRNNWDIDQRLYKALPAKFGAMALDENRSDNANLSAARLIFDMAAMNARSQDDNHTNNGRPASLSIHLHTGGLEDLSRLLAAQRAIENTTIAVERGSE